MGKYISWFKGVMKKLGNKLIPRKIQKVRLNKLINAAEFTQWQKCAFNVLVKQNLTVEQLTLVIVNKYSPEQMRIAGLAFKHGRPIEEVEYICQHSLPYSISMRARKVSGDNRAIIEVVHISNKVFNLKQMEEIFLAHKDKRSKEEIEFMYHDKFDFRQMGECRRAFKEDRTMEEIEVFYKPDVAPVYMNIARLMYGQGKSTDVVRNFINIVSGKIKINLKETHG